MRGKLICISGISGSGKSSQVEMLGTALEERNFSCERVELFNFNPYDIKKKDKKCIEDIMAELKKQKIPVKDYNLAIDAYWYQYIIRTYIEKPIEEGKIVILDRYIEMLKLKYFMNHLEETYVNEVLNTAPNPDVFIFLKAPIELCRERILLRNREDVANNSDISFLKAQNDYFLSLSSQFHYQILDATEPREEVHKKIIKRVNEVLDNQ